MRHKQAVSQHLAKTKKKAAQEKAEHEMALKSMKDLDRIAQEQYRRDVAAGVLAADDDRAHAEPIGPDKPDVAPAAAAAAPDLRGWYFDKDSGYYYHDDVGWYYHKDTGMYYGGEPAEWAAELPAEKRGMSFPKAPAPPASEVVQVVTVRKAQVAKHPLMDIGGHRAPVAKKAGGVGAATAQEAAGAAGAAGAGAGSKGPGASAREAALKRKRDPEKEEALKQKEAEFKRMKEAAKKRNEVRAKERWGQD